MCRRHNLFVAGVEIRITMPRSGYPKLFRQALFIIIYLNLNTLAKILNNLLCK